MKQNKLEYSNYIQPRLFNQHKYIRGKNPNFTNMVISWKLQTIPHLYYVTGNKILDCCIPIQSAYLRNLDKSAQPIKMICELLYSKQQLVRYLKGGYLVLLEELIFCLRVMLGKFKGSHTLICVSVYLQKSIWEHGVWSSMIQSDPANGSVYFSDVGSVP